MTTADRVLDRLQAYKLRQEGDGKYRCHSPLRADSDSPSFTLKVERDGEHGAWHDKVTDNGGSLYELAHALGIETPTNGRREVTSTKREYAGIDDYAKAHGLTADDLKAAGWREVKHQNRAALRYPTANGERVRFLDNAGEKYKAVETGYKPCWYGLKRAITMAEGKSPIVICNGEISTISAQKHGIPACAVAGAGERKLPDELLAELRNAWKGAIWIALDCDDTGRRAAADMQQQIPEAVVIDLLLTDGGDLADFAMLNGADSMTNLARLVSKQQTTAAAEKAKAEPAAKVVLLSSYDVATSVWDEFDAAVADPCDVRGLKSGLTDFDALTKGFQGARSYLILGATNMGKSTLACTLARNLMEQAPGMIVPTEMTPNAWSRRIVAAMAKVNAEKLETGVVTDAELKAVYAAIGQFSEKQTLYMNLTRPNVKSIAEQIEAAKAKGVKWVLIDSFQRLKARSDKAVYEKTVELADALQEIVIDSGLVFIVTSQTGRNSKDNGDKRPRLFDAKGGGELEENADVVLGLYDDEYYVQRFDKPADPTWVAGCVEVSLLKHRHRPITKPKCWLKKTGWGYEDANVRTFDVQAGKWEDK